jgi:hypothetical protein
MLLIVLQEKGGSRTNRLLYKAGRQPMNGRIMHGEPSRPEAECAETDVS